MVNIRVPLLYVLDIFAFKGVIDFTGSYINRKRDSQRAAWVKFGNFLQ